MSDIKSRIKEANNELRNAQNLMFNGKKNESAEMVKSLLLTSDEILKELPDDFQAKQLKQKVERLQKDLERKGVSFGDKKEATPQNSAVKVENNEEKSNELPSGIKSQLNFFKNAIKNKNITKAENDWALINSRYKGKFDENHPEILEAKQMLDELKKAIEEKEAEEKKQALIEEKNKDEKENREKESAPWIEKLRELPQVGNTILNHQGLREDQQQYKKALETFKNYKAQTFEFGKSEDLIKVEADIERMLGEFPVKYIENANEMARDLTDRIKQRYDFLLNDQAWQQKEAPNNKPMIISQADMADFEESTANIVSLYSSETEASKKLVKQLELIKEEDSRRRKTRAERTGMEPEVAVDNKQDIENLATEIVTKKVNAAEIIQTRIISKWVEKSEWVFVDTIKSAAEYRTTKSLNVQVAAKENDGKTMLHTLHIESKLQSDNTWGNLYGHIMWSNETIINFSVEA